MLEITLQHNEKESCLNLLGELDISTVEKFRLSVEDIPETVQEVHLDFHGVEFVDSTGIGSLVQLMNQLRAKDVKVMVKRIPKEIFEVFDLLGIPELMGEEFFDCLN